jgi:8-oxo-dGTP pyrophosphatase MutT (NUDIX family)
MLEPQAAATVMIARENAAQIELFLLRRSSRSAFMPDVFVFPGGRVESQDEAAQTHGLLVGATRPLDPAYFYAAARETFEESGLLYATKVSEAARLEAARGRILAGTQSFAELLAELDAQVDAGALRYFSRWVTPPIEARRFDTHFFVARAPAGQVARADAFETHDGVWITPREALARSRAGAFALSFPTIKHLERVRPFDSIDALLDYAANKPIHTVIPDVGADRAVTIPPALEGVW